MKQKTTKRKLLMPFNFLLLLMIMIWANQSKAQASLHFDGLDDRVSVSHIANQVGTSNLTIEAWVKPEGFGTYRNVVLKGNYGYGMIIDINNKLGYWSNSSYTSCPSFGFVPTGVWSHLAIVVVKNTSVTFYINGVNVGSSTSSGHTTINSGATDPMIIGRQGSFNGNYFKGAIDELRIWNTARTQSQILANMNSQMSYQSGLIQLFNFSDGTAKGTNTFVTTLSDASINSNNGTLSGFTLSGNTSNWWCDFRNRIEVKGNKKLIGNLNFSTKYLDSTFLGNTINGSTIKRRFKLFNYSTTSLTISSITLTGSNASDFSISNAPSSISSGDSAFFTVIYTPSVQRESFANVVINNNGCESSTFTFGIKASFDVDFSPLVVSTFTGNGFAFSTDGTGGSASHNYPTGITYDKQGNMFVAEYGSSKIRKITPSGVVTTFAGNGTPTHADGAAASASFRYPTGVAFDTAGNLLVADFLNNRIRKIDISTNVVSTIAGNATQSSIDGTGTGASFAWPWAIVVDANNNAFVSDYAGHKIRKITPAGVVTTFVGNGSGYQDGTGTGARIDSPKGLVIDKNGNMYLCDQNNRRIRKITPAGVVTTYAGNGVNASIDGNGTNASFMRPTGITIDKNDNLYIVDETAANVRKISPNGDVTTIAGAGVTGFLNGNADVAQFSYLNGIVVNKIGDCFVAEHGHRIRKIGKGFTEINVKANNTNIVDGDVTPSISDSTNFGSVISGNIKRRFKISNVGIDTLKISSIIISGTNASEFVISNAPTRVLAGDSGMFTVTFTPASSGVRTATITINSNDADEAAFDFGIEGSKVELGKSLNFDGANDHVRVNHNSTLNPSTAMTIETWVYRTTDKHATILSKYDDDDNSRGYMINFGELSNNKKICFIATTNGNWIPSPKIQWETNTELNLNEWYHIAITYTQNGANNLKYYVNGELKDQTTWNFPIFTSPANLNLGGYDGPGNGLNGGANTRFFKGELDEVRIWNYERSCAQIKSTLGCELLGNESGLLAYYNFNQGIAGGSNSTITSLNDGTSNSFNGTLINFGLSSNSSNWLASGGNVTGNTPKLFPEINIKGNSISILNNDSLVSTSDSTDFGLVNNNTKRNFKIENTGSDTLKITGLVVTGMHAGDFTPTNVPSYILPNSSSQFTISFNSSNITIRNAIIKIYSNDCDESIYKFNITATKVSCDLSSTIPSTAGTYISSQTGTSGAYTCYCDAGGNLLLALDLNGTGAVIPSNGVSLQIGTTTTTTYNTPGGIIGNPYGGVIFNRKWNVTPTTQPTSNVKVKFFFTQLEYDSVRVKLSTMGTTITSPTQFEMYKLFTNGFGDPHANGASGIVLINGINSSLVSWKYAAVGSNHSAEFLVSSFSGGGGGAGAGAIPLPLDFISFTAKKLNKTSALINWIVTNQINHSYFEIERSLDGINFINVGKVYSNQNNSGKYQFTDMVLNGTQIAYYKIKQIDVNGKSNSTGIQLVNFSSNNSKLLVFPNPFNNEITIDFNIEDEESIEVYITDAMGKTVYKNNVFSKSNLDLSSLDKGMYQLTIIKSQETKTIKIIKQ